MAVAKQVTQVEPVALNWIEIEDEDGAKYRYVKKGDCLDMAVRHVIRVFGGGAKIVRDNTVQVLLRQDGPGLPNKIVIEHSELTGRNPGRPVASEREYRIEYEMT